MAKDKMQEFYEIVDIPKEIDNKYNSLFSSFYHLSNISNVKCFHYDDGKFSDYYCFSLDKNVIRIYNNVIKINKKSFDCFIQYCFDNYNIDYIETGLFIEENKISEKKNAFIVKQLDDYIMNLPSSVDEYLESLGKQTKKHLLYYIRRANKELGELKVSLKNSIEITYDDVLSIVQLNNNRRKHNGAVSFPNNEEIKDHYNSIKKYGFIFTIENNSKILASAGICIVGSGAFLLLIGSDYQYDKYNIGNIVLYETIKFCITNKISYYHFLWGYIDYKTRFGGQKVLLNRYRIYKKKTLIFFVENIKNSLTIKIQSIKNNSLTYKRIVLKIKKIIRSFR